MRVDYRKLVMPIRARAAEAVDARRGTRGGRAHVPMAGVLGIGDTAVVMTGQWAADGKVLLVSVVYIMASRYGLVTLS